MSIADSLITAAAVVAPCAIYLWLTHRTTAMRLRNMARESSARHKAYHDFITTLRGGAAASEKPSAAGQAEKVSAPQPNIIEVKPRQLPRITRKYQP